jgi:hypothetical protein
MGAAGAVWAWWVIGAKPPPAAFVSGGEGCWRRRDDGCRVRERVLAVVVTQRRRGRCLAAAVSAWWG